MKCQFCKNLATVHVTKIIKHDTREMHLCEECAQKRNLFPAPQQELNIPALLEFLMTQAAETLAKGDLNGLTCPHCGIKYSQFRAQGRLGCPEDYEVFREGLETLLERIHHHTRHLGKIPRRFGLRQRQSEQKDLFDRLEQAVKEERYEDAAQLRDLIRNMGTADEPG